MRMVITLKSGAQVSADVTELTVGRSKLTGERERLAWTSSSDRTSKLQYVRLEEIAAIHTEDELTASPSTEMKG